MGLSSCRWNSERRFQGLLALFGTGRTEGAELEINLSSKGSEKNYHATCSLIVEGKWKLLVSQIGSQGSSKQLLMMMVVRCASGK